MPPGPFDRDDEPMTGAGAGQRGVQRQELLFALEQIEDPVHAALILRSWR